MSCETGDVVPGLLDDLMRIGVCRGDFLVVHSSFKSLGLRDRTPSDVIATLLEAAGEDGTLMMPTFTYSYSGIWNVQPFNLAATPGRNNGILTETLRKYPGALRSGHPTYSVAAVGKHAEIVTANRENSSALGIGSSYDEAYRLGAKVLLVGMGNNRNSMLHYAEVAAGLPYNDIPFREFWGRTALVEKNGKAVEVSLEEEFPGCSQNFGVADGYLEEVGAIRRGRICSADSMLMSAKDMLEAVIARLREEPAWLLCENIVCEPCTLRKRRLRDRGLI